MLTIHQRVRVKKDDREGKIVDYLFLDSIKGGETIDELQYKAHYHYNVQIDTEQYPEWFDESELEVIE
jgi:hypothetical protein